MKLPLRASLARHEILTSGRRIADFLIALALGAAIALVASANADRGVARQIAPLEPVVEHAGGGVTVVRVGFSGGRIEGWCHIVLYSSDRAGWTLRC